MSVRWRSRHSERHGADSQPVRIAVAEGRVHSHELARPLPLGAGATQSSSSRSSLCFMSVQEARTVPPTPAGFSRPRDTR